MPWHEYLNLELLKLTGRHTSGALGLIVGFWLVGLAVEWIVPSGVVFKYIEICEKIVVVAGVTWLTLFVVWELILLLIKLVRGQAAIAIWIH